MSVEGVRADPNWERVDRYLAWLAKRAPQGLQRVMDAEKWTSGHFLTADGAHFLTADGARCVLGHAEDFRWVRERDKILCDKSAQGFPGAITAPFDDLARIHGLAPVVAAVQIRAAELLAAGVTP